MNIVQCQVCTAILYDAERGPILAAIQHREKEHPPVVQKDGCEVCGREFPSEASLGSHRGHHSRRAS